MPAPDVFSVPVGLFAYGPVPGVELIPYFLALLAWVGLALGALFLAPIKAAVRLIRRPRVAQPPVPAVPAEPAVPPVPTPPVPEPSVEAPRDHG